MLSNAGKPKLPVAPARFTAKEQGASADNCLTDCTFASFEIDGSQAQLDKYDLLAKGLGLQYMMRAQFRDLYIHHVPATGPGCDFLQDTLIGHVLAMNCGRLDAGQEMGGAGIDLGGWGSVERLTLTACIAVGNGTDGIFVELQQDKWPPVRGVKIGGCHASGNRFGISDCGAEGLIVSECVMTSNLETGYNVSAQGTAKVGGRGGLLTGSVIDGNVRDGVAIGNIPGSYTVRGNRIMHNGRYGFHQHNLKKGDAEPAFNIVIESNDITDNALDGIYIDAPICDANFYGNRIRNNGRQCERAEKGSGNSVSYTATGLVDKSANWIPDGHKGKTLTVGDMNAIVATNTDKELQLAPHRPGAPPVRAGLTLANTVFGSWIRDNRVWDNQSTKTQTHAVRIAEAGDWQTSRITDNDFIGNAASATQREGQTDNALLRDNYGLEAEKPRVTRQ